MNAFDPPHPPTDDNRHDVDDDMDVVDADVGEVCATSHDMSAFNPHTPPLPPGDGVRQQ